VNRFCARARFRDYDGKIRDIEATDATAPASIRALKLKLRDRTTPNDDEITRETRIIRLAELWIKEITAEERLVPQTIHRYQTSLRTHILPALGNLRIREASVGRLDKLLRGIAKDHPSAAKAPRSSSARCSPSPSATARSRPTPSVIPADYANRDATSSSSPTSTSRPCAMIRAVSNSRLSVWTG
jgi:hypothetical protein